MTKPLFRVKRYAHPKYKFVVRAKIDGKWKRRYFETEAEAHAYADDQVAKSHSGAGSSRRRAAAREAKPRRRAVSRAKAESLIAAVGEWHHRFEILPGLVTPGSYDPIFLLEKMALPPDLSGRRVLDIGPSDGYFSLQLRRRGADVVAVDYRPKEGHGFAAMEHVSGLDFDYRQANVYEITPEEFGTFDIVLFLGLLYHLPDLLRALLIVRRVCSGLMFLESHCAIGFAPETAAARYYRGSSLNRDFTNFWSPNSRCFADLLYDAGFDVEREESWGDRYFAASRVNEDPARALKLKVAYGLFDEAAEARKLLDQQNAGPREEAEPVSAGHRPNGADIRPLQVQLFADNGNGFDEAAAISAELEPGQRQAITFEHVERLRPAPGRGLRIDPADSPGFIDITAINVIRDRDGAVLYAARSADDFQQMQVPRSVIKQEADAGVTLVAMDADPQLYLPPIDLPADESYRVEVVMEAHSAPAALVARYQRSLGTVVDELEHQKRMVAERESLRPELDTAKTQVAAYEAESKRWDKMFLDLKTALEASQAELGRLSYHREIKESQVQTLEMALAERQARLTEVSARFEEDRARNAKETAEAEQRFAATLQSAAEQARAEAAREAATLQSAAEQARVEAAREAAALRSAAEQARAEAAREAAAAAAEHAQQVAALEREIESVQQEVVTRRTEMSRKTGELEAAESQNRQLRRQIEDGSQQIRALEEHVRNLDAYIEEGRAKFTILWDDLQTARNRAHELHSQNVRNEEQFRKSEAENRELRSIIEEGRAKFAQLWSELHETRSQRDEFRTEAERRSEQIGAREAEVWQLQVAVENARAESRRLEAELKSERSSDKLEALQAEARGARERLEGEQRATRNALDEANRNAVRLTAALEVHGARAAGARRHTMALEVRVDNVSRELLVAAEGMSSGNGSEPAMIATLAADIERIRDCSMGWKAAKATGLLSLAEPGAPRTAFERRTIATELKRKLQAVEKDLRDRRVAPESLAAVIARLFELRRTTTQVLHSIDLRRVLGSTAAKEQKVSFSHRLAEVSEKQVVRPLFDGAWYLARNPDVAATGVDPLDHYLGFGVAEGRDPNPVFSTTWYLAQNPDVVTTGLNPLVHYARYGEQEGRNPHALFDSAWYSQRNPDVAAARQNPLQHYLHYGAFEGRDPHPLFDTEYYLAQNPDAIGLNPLEHYLTVGVRHRRSPHPWFDAAFYLQQNPDVVISGGEPLQHYLSIGAAEGRDPHLGFDAEWYLQQTGDDAPRAAGNPLLHYVSTGRERGLSPAQPVAPPPQRTPAPPLTPPPAAPAELVEFELHQPTFDIPKEPRLRGEHARPDVEAIAFYLPQFHRIPQNDAWWGEGFTEWTNVRRGEPNFAGQYQPHVPSELGYYDLSDPAALERQARLARAAGIHGFCLYFYWFAGEVLLEFPLRTIVQSGTDFPFCICWANENWTRRWDGKENEILISQKHSAEDDFAFIEYVEPALTARSYIRVDGKPMLLVYRASLLPDARATLRRWRERFRARGHGELHIVMVRSFSEREPAERYGFDAAVQFPPHFHATPVTSLVPNRSEQFSGIIYDYMEVRGKALAEYRAAAPDQPLLYPGVMPSWDNTARRGASASVWVNSSPEAYHEWLAEVASLARDRGKPGERFVFINAWNEWAEGCHLEPDERFGFAWLNATSLALHGSSSEGGHGPEAAIAYVEPPQVGQLAVEPLTGTVRVAISVLLFHREDILPAFLASLLPQIRYAAEREDISCELFLSFNYRPSAGLREEIETTVAELLPDGAASVQMVENGFNLGFGAGHNLIFDRATSDVFVTLNSDLELEDSNWLTEVVERFRTSDAAILGLTQNASVLRSDACGVALPYTGAEFDFVDASLLAVRSDLARRFGLFSPAFDYFYFEDVDLCLRYRQIGLRLELLDIPSKHERSSSSRLLPQYAVESVLNRNRARFFERWGTYLRTRVLPNRLAVRFTQPDRQLQCASLPSILGLLQEHPTAVLDLWGVHEQLVSLFQHDRIRVVPWWQQPREADYLRYYEVRDDLPRDRPLVRAMAERLATEPDLAAAREHLESIGDATAEGSRALLFLPRRQRDFEGRQPEAAALATAEQVLHSHGFAVWRCSEYGNFEIEEQGLGPADEWTFAAQVNGREIVAEVLRARIVVTTDSWVAELAQLTNRRTLLWLGAIAAERAIWNTEHTTCFRDESLDCLGCHAQYGQQGRNTCLRGDIACMRDELLPRFTELAGRMCDGESLPPPQRRAAFSTRAYATAASTQLNLQAWPRSSSGSVLVLTPVNPLAPDDMIEHARQLAQQAIDGMRGCRIVFDDEGVAPLRGVPHVQRQASLAALRQQMLERNLRDERWVFWVDLDIVSYSADLIDQLISRAEGGIAAPLVIMEGDLSEPTNEHGFGPGRFYDIAGFVENGRWARFTQPYFDQKGPVYQLDSVGSCYLVNADLYRHGAKHAIDPASARFMEEGREWNLEAIQRSQAEAAHAFTEHYTVCEFARRSGLPVQAFADLVAYHEKPQSRRWNNTTSAKPETAAAAQ